MHEVEDIAGAFLEEELISSPVPEGLRAVVPVVPGADEEALLEGVSQHRVLLIRGGAVIAVTTLISVGGALLIHAMFAGVIVLGMLFPWRVVQTNDLRSPALGQDADAGGGYIVLAEDNEERGASSPAVADSLNRGVKGGDMQPVVLPPLPEAAPAQVPVAQVAPPDVALNVPDGMGNPRVTPPVRKTPVVDNVNAEPPPPVLPKATSIASDAGTKGTPALGTNSHAGEAFPGESEPNWRPEKGSDANGSGGRTGGMGAGSGRDYGLSAANRDVQILSWAPLSVPMKYEMRGPIKPIGLSITVLADGTMGEIKVEESCGIDEVDQIAIAHTRATARFNPAIVAGKAVTRVTHLGYGGSFR